MDQRKEAVFRYIDEHRQEILDDWKALVNPVSYTHLTLPTKIAV